MPDFQNPAAFLLLLIIPAFYALRILNIFSKLTFPAVLCDWNGKEFDWNDKPRKVLSFISSLFAVLGLIFVITAFADPVISHEEKVFTSLGSDVVFVVDTSPSMAAKDMDGFQRIEAAKNTINNVTQENAGIRFGIVALGSEAAVIVPPTTDYSIFQNGLSNISVGILGNGSAIGDGLSTAVCHLVSSSAEKKCIVLFTDGENNAGEIHPETAATLADENNIVLYVVGIGSKGTVPIEYTDPQTGKLYSGYLDSNFDSSSLRKIANIGKGRYFEVKTTDELKSALNLISKTEAVSQNYTYRTVSDTYYKPVIVFAVILFILAWIIRRLILREIFGYRYYKRYIVRFVCFIFALVSLLVAYSGVSWGTYLMPVYKSETAVSFVFDISNSMMAKDGPEGMTRLKAASVYAKKLLSNMNGISASVVLAKGEGIKAIPLTEDKAMIESLLEVMSPSLMTVPGTSLAKGLHAAMDSFPKNYSNAGRIWIFTDGEETDNHLSGALIDCVKAGIPVSIIGFGNETESEVLAGDGKTYVKTALRTEEILKSIGEAENKTKFLRGKTPVIYLNSVERGSGAKLLSQLSGAVDRNGEKAIITYETKPVPRYKFFLLLSVILYSLGFVITEFDISKYIKHRKRIGFGLLCIFILTNFNSCKKSSVSETAAVFDGVLQWNKKQYRKAVSDFMIAGEKAEKKNDSIEKAYILYDLGTAYSLVNEDNSALEKFLSIPEDAPSQVRYAAFYNAGILAHRNGNFEDASAYFKKALEADCTKINAKINLELSMAQVEAKVRNNQNTLKSVSEEKDENPEVEKAVFQHIKENDQKQWKNSESSQNQNSANDY